MIAALALCRFLQFGAAMLMFGTSAFVWALVPADLARTLNPRIVRRAFVLVLVIAATSLAWVALEAGQMGDGWSSILDPQVLRDVLFDTAFGWVWQVQLLLVAGLVAVVFFGPAERLGPTALLSAMVLGSLGFVGHATMHTGAAGWTHRANHALHLLAAGAWIGSLVPLLPVMGSLESPERRSDAALALRRFSQVGHWVVALVVITGCADTILLLGRWPLYPSSPYTSLLLGKTVLVVGMIAIALVNRYGLVPRMGGSPVATLASLRRNTRAELVIGALVLILSSALGLLDPL